MDTGDTPNIEPIATAEKPVNNRRENGTFAPGNNANPNGRPPKGHSITETIKAMMDEKPEIKKALGQKILQMALAGDITAIKTLWNYIDGMPMLGLDVTSKGEALHPLVVIDTDGE